MIKRLVGGLALAGAGCLAYGVVEARSFRVRRVSVPVLPAGAPNIRVLHLSDIHLVTRQHRKLAFVRALAGFDPDLVINTGDNVGNEAALEPLLTGFGRLLEAPGAFVMGSNDYTAARLGNPLSYLVKASEMDGIPDRGILLPTDRLRVGLSSGGWRDVTGHRTAFDIQGLRIEIRGTDDAHLHRDDYDTVAGPAADGVDLSIGVTHAPYRRVLDAMVADDLPLIFAGHTHGGQVCLPGIGALTTNCDLPLPMAKGLSHYQAAGKASWLHVSGGVGTSPYSPYRFACPPEVTLLTLTSGSNG